jgi:hypothetical protein
MGDFARDCKYFFKKVNVGAFKVLNKTILCFTQ